MKGINELIGAMAIPIGVAAACVAAGLLGFINFFTNLFFFPRTSTAAVTPASHALGLSFHGGSGE